MDTLRGLLGAGWIEWGLVGACLMVAAGWLLVRAIRFFRGQSGCDCAGRCPVERMLGTLNQGSESSQDGGQE